MPLVSMCQLLDEAARGGYNVAVTKEVVACADERGVTVEGELGTLGEIEDVHGSNEVRLTDPDEAVKEIQLGVRHGVRKINVDTDSRLAVTGAIRQVFVESPEQFDRRDYLKPARAAMQQLIATRMHDFGQAGHASDYKPLSLEEMREGYAAAGTAV